MERWIGDYSRRYCETTVDPTANGYGRYLCRLWSCWSYHWRMAAESAGNRTVDGRHVAERLVSGQGFSGKGDLGGDVLHDTVLAQALLLGERQAIAHFEDAYRAVLLKQMRRVSPAVADDPQTWPRFLDKLLVGCPDPPGKIARYQGRSGLRHWLGTVARCFAVDMLRELRSATPPTEEYRPTDALAPALDETAMSRECLELWQGILRKAVGSLRAEQRLLLCLVFEQGLPGKQVAQVLRIHPGTVSRQRQAAEDALREEVERISEERGRRESYQDCLRELLHGPERMSFAQLLIEALRETKGDVRA
ncbi:MAG: hypothetical protein HYS13_15065 [Planctomycetia bacterium]|nr:hypothetical protein [Planctomycetia bacterium]